ncbi:hypothetical protein FOCC_FOCC016648 [Frankliniella occidentalis]|nr:hypothetical protein FOCC_FOCC016648 [Frankliniella occidentalis]
MTQMSLSQRLLYGSPLYFKGRHVACGYLLIIGKLLRSCLMEPNLNESLPPSDTCKIKQQQKPCQ